MVCGNNNNKRVFDYLEQVANRVDKYTFAEDVQCAVTKVFFTNRMHNRNQP